MLTGGDKVDIEKMIVDLVRNYISDDNIDVDGKLVEAYGFDSLKIVSLLVDIEKTFKIKIETDDLKVELVNSISGLVKMVEAHCNNI